MMSNQNQGKDHGKQWQDLAQDQDKDWQDLARLASQEQDPEKLMEIVRQLNSALENERKEETNGKLAEVA